MKIQYFALIGLLAPTLSFGANFISDGKYNAMGGTGVVTADLGSAGFYNPATAAISEDRFTIVLPSIGAQVQDSDDFVNALEDFKHTYKTFEDDPSNAQNRINTSISLSNLKNKNAFGNGGVGLSVGVNSMALSGVLYVSAFTDFTVISEVSDSDINDIALGTIPPTLTSKGRVLGFGLAELGLALAKNVYIFGQDIAVGITPKTQRFYTYHYEVGIDNFNRDDWNSAQYRNEETGFNFDLGAIWHLGPYRLGASASNIIAHSISSIEQTRVYTYKLSPKLTVGAGFKTELITLAADLDLTKQEKFDASSGPAVNDDSQYFRLGAELNAFGWAQARVGYRYDIQDSYENVFTFGAGISPFDTIHLDVAAELINKNSYGGAVKINFTL